MTCKGLSKHLSSIWLCWKQDELSSGSIWTSEGLNWLASWFNASPLLLCCVPGLQCSVCIKSGGARKERWLTGDKVTGSWRSVTYGREWRPSRVLQSNRWVTVAQIIVELNVGSRMTEYMVLHGWINMRQKMPLPSNLSWAHYDCWRCVF